VASVERQHFSRRAAEDELVAVILAAGRGSRLGSGVKCLVEIGGRPLLEHQFRALEEAGVSTVVVVAGHQVERVRRAVGGRADVIINDRYTETNSVYSFMLARESVDGGALVLNADVLFHPEVIRRLLDVDGPALAFDSAAELDDETMKVEVDDGRFVRMSKTLEPEVQSGENLGILKLDGSAALAAFVAATAVVEQGGEQSWVGSAINAVAACVPIAAVDVGTLPWTEIDYRIDLDHARRHVWPQLDSLDEEESAA
jgi:L-glutamine-phosphate cytidylyltransferase